MKFIPYKVLIFCFSLVIAGFHHFAQADVTGYTIKDTEGLYQECKKAQAEYKERPEEIGNSVCGAYIQGFLGGFSTGGIEVLTYVRVPEEQYKIINQINKEFCTREIKNISFQIDKFLSWRETNPSFNDVASSALLGSIVKNCVSNKIKQKL